MLSTVAVSKLTRRRHEASVALLHHRENISGSREATSRAVEVVLRLAWNLGLRDAFSKPLASHVGPLGLSGFLLGLCFRSFFSLGLSLGPS